jgi:hypothetical protein
MGPAAAADNHDHHSSSEANTLACVWVCQAAVESGPIDSGPSLISWSSNAYDIVPAVHPIECLQNSLGHSRAPPIPFLV